MRKVLEQQLNVFGEDADKKLIGALSNVERIRVVTAPDKLGKNWSCRIDILATIAAEFRSTILLIHVKCPVA